MKHFKVFPGDNTEALALQINYLIATALEIPSTTPSFFNQFNQDVIHINYILDHLISLDTHQKAYQLQEEHNKILEREHTKWVNSGSNYAVGVNAVKQLVPKAAQYQKALTLKKQFEVKQKKIQDYLWHVTWQPILKIAEESGQREAITLLKVDWMQQQRFAACNAYDLAQILKKFNQLYLFLKLIQSIPHQNKIMADIVHRNTLLLEKLNKQLTVAISWRIHAASLRNNLCFDDALWALRYQLSALLGDYESEHSKKDEENPALLSRALTPDLMRIFIKHLQETQQTIKDDEGLLSRCKDKWLGCRWIRDPYHQYPIQVVVTKDLEIIPRLLAPMIPQSDGFPDDFIRYFYFRGRLPEKPLAKILKKRLLGKPYELIIFLNEATYQVSAFEAAAHSEKPMSLFKMTQTPGFKNALLFPDRAVQERARMRCLLPNSSFLAGLTWLPRSLFVSKTQAFWTHWEGLLSQIENDIITKTQSIIPKIILSLEMNLIHSIKESPTSFPQNWISDIHDLMRYYGNTLQKDQVKILLSPFYLFTQFQFVVASGERARQLDSKAVDVFLSYAKLCWTPIEYTAAQAVASLLEGHFPENNKAHQALISQLSVWFSETRSPHNAVIAFLNKLGLEVIVKIGSRSNELAYQFLKQYSMAAMKIWEKEREQDLNKKYFLLISALEKPVGSELNLYTREQGVEIEFMDDLKRDPSRRYYILALADALEDYIKQYDGRNGAYATWVFYHFEQHRMKYFIQRIQYLLKNDDTVKLTTQELSLFQSQSSDGFLKGILKNALLTSDTMLFKQFNKNMYSMISVSHDGELEGLYHFKRVKFLVEEGDFDNLKRETLFFDRDNPCFQSYFNEYLRAYLKKYIFDIAPMDDCKLEWTIEFYGDQHLKEEHRYLSVKRFLECRTYRSMPHFLKKMKRYLVSSQLSELFSLDEYKKRLFALYQSHNQLGWDAYAQSLMEQLAYPQTQFSLFGARLAWLNQLLFHRYPAILSDTLVLGMHIKNWEASNEGNLSTFFGPLLPQVKEKISQYLASDCKIDAIEPVESKFILIARYLEDETFKSEDQWEHWTFKIEVLKGAYAIVGLLKKKAWPEAKQRLHQLHTALTSDKYLLPYKEGEMKIKRGYYDQVFQALKECVLDAKSEIHLEDLQAQGILPLLQVPSVKISPILRMRSRLF